MGDRLQILYSPSLMSSTTRQFRALISAQWAVRILPDLLNPKNGVPSCMKVRARGLDRQHQTPRVVHRAARGSRPANGGPAEIEDPAQFGNRTAILSVRVRSRKPSMKQRSSSARSMARTAGRPTIAQAGELLMHRGKDVRTLRLESREVSLSAHEVEMGERERKFLLESAGRNRPKNGRRRLQHRRLRGIDRKDYVDVTEPSGDTGRNTSGRIADMAQPLAVKKHKARMALRE